MMVIKLLRSVIHAAVFFSKEGFDIPSLVKFKRENKKVKAVYCQDTVCEAIPAEQITNEQLLELNVDILIPAALGKRDSR